MMLGENFPIQNGLNVIAKRLRLVTPVEGGNALVSRASVKTVSIADAVRGEGPYFYYPSKGRVKRTVTLPDGQVSRLLRGKVRCQAPWAGTFNNESIQYSFVALDFCLFK